MEAPGQVLCQPLNGVFSRSGDGVFQHDGSPGSRQNCRGSVPLSVPAPLSWDDFSHARSSAARQQV
jgi:hypothetical protein